MPGKWEGKSKKTDSSNLGNLYTKHFKANHCGLKVLSSFSLCSAHTGQGDDEEERGKMTRDTWHNLSLLFLNFLPLMILFLIPIISFVLFSFFYLSFTSSSKPYGEVLCIGIYYRI